MSLQLQIISMIVIMGFGLAVGTVLLRYWQGGQFPKSSSDKAELTARIVLIGTVAVTVLMVFLQFETIRAFPEIPTGIITLNVIAVFVYIAVQVLGTTQASREIRMRVVELQRKSLDNPNNVRY